MALKRTAGMGRKRVRVRSFRRMDGFTIMELLISTTIGLFVVAAVLVLYLNAQESAAYMNSASRVQESGRFGVDHVARTLRMAGYDDPTSSGVVAVVPALEGTTSSDVTLSMSPFTLKTNTDVVKISHETADGLVNCQGIEAPAPANVNDWPWVTNIYAISDNSELICSTITKTSTATTTVAPLVIAEGVEDMVLQFGIDADADGIANRYVRESGVADWSLVVSAKMTLLVNSVETAFASTLNGCKSCDTFDPPDSNLVRAEFHTTVRLRNM